MSEAINKLKLWCKKFRSTPKLCPKKTNSRWRPPLSWIDFPWLVHTALFQLPTLTSVQNFMPISTANFLKFKMADVHHVGFSENDLWHMHHLRLFNVHNHTKFGAKVLINAQIMLQKPNSRWRPLIPWMTLHGFCEHTAVFQLLI